MRVKVESVLTAILDVYANNEEIAKLLNISTRRIVRGKVKRKLINGIIQKEFFIQIMNGNSGNNDESEITNNEIESKGINASLQKCRENIFHTVLSPKDRNVRDDELNHSVIRDFCHDICRLNTFALIKVYVHNYDGTCPPSGPREKSVHQMLL